MANPKTKRRKKIILFSTIGLALIALIATAVLRKRDAVITVQTEKITRRNITELVVANGRVQPVLQVKISPEVSGEIIELPVKEGQRVKKGDLLLRIKPDNYVANLNSSKANYNFSLSSKGTSKATLDKTEAEFKRISELFQNKLVSDSNYLEGGTAHKIAKSQLQGAVHQVEMANAALKKAEEDLAKTTITSPLDGTVSRLNSQVGERVVGTAMMAGTEIMTVADLNEMEARVDVGEIDVVLIAVGQKSRLEVDAFKDRKFNGTVTDIANSSKGSGQAGMGGGGGGQSQEATKFEVRIRFNEKEIFRPGMSVNAEIETRSRTNVLAVPIASVTTRVPKDSTTDKVGDPKGSNLQAAEKSGATNTLSRTNATRASEGRKPGEVSKPIEVAFLVENNTAKMVPVKLGISNDSYWEITDGVSEGQEVISGGFKAISRELEDGKKVKIGGPKSEERKDKK